MSSGTSTDTLVQTLHTFMASMQASLDQLRTAVDSVINSNTTHVQAKVASEQVEPVIAQSTTDEAAAAKKGRLNDFLVLLATKSCHDDPNGTSDATKAFLKKNGIGITQNDVDMKMDMKVDEVGAPLSKTTTPSEQACVESEPKRCKRAVELTGASYDQNNLLLKFAEHFQINVNTVHHYYQCFNVKHTNPIVALIFSPSYSPPSITSDYSTTKCAHLSMFHKHQVFAVVKEDLHDEVNFRQFDLCNEMEANGAAWKHALQQLACNLKEYVKIDEGYINLEPVLTLFLFCLLPTSTFITPTQSYYQSEHYSVGEKRDLVISLFDILHECRNLPGALWKHKTPEEFPQFMHRLYSQIYIDSDCTAHFTDVEFIRKYFFSMLKKTYFDCCKSSVAEFEHYFENLFTQTYADEISQHFRKTKVDDYYQHLLDSYQGRLQLYESGNLYRPHLLSTKSVQPQTIVLRANPIQQECILETFWVYDRENRRQETYKYGVVFYSSNKNCDEHHVYTIGPVDVNEDTSANDYIAQVVDPVCLHYNRNEKRLKEVAWILQLLLEDWIDQQTLPNTISDYDVYGLKKVLKFILLIMKPFANFYNIHGDMSKPLYNINMNGTMRRYITTVLHVLLKKHYMCESDKVVWVDFLSDVLSLHPVVTILPTPVNRTPDFFYVYNDIHFLLFNFISLYTPEIFSFADWRVGLSSKDALFNKKTFVNMDYHSRDNVAFIQQCRKKGSYQSYHTLFTNFFPAHPGVARTFPDFILATYLTKCADTNPCELFKLVVDRWKRAVQEGTTYDPAESDAFNVILLTAETLSDKVWNSSTYKDVVEELLYKLMTQVQTSHSLPDKYSKFLNRFDQVVDKCTCSYSTNYSFILRVLKVLFSNTLCLDKEQWITNELAVYDMCMIALRYLPRLHLAQHKSLTDKVQLFIVKYKDRFHAFSAYGDLTQSRPLIKFLAAHYIRTLCYSFPEFVSKESCCFATQEIGSALFKTVFTDMLGYDAKNSESVNDLVTSCFLPIVVMLKFLEFDLSKYKFDIALAVKDYLSKNAHSIQLFSYDQQRLL